MVKVFHARSWDKKKQNQFLLSKAFNASVVYNVEKMRHFVTERPDIVQNVSCLILKHFVPKYILQNI